MTKPCWLILDTDNLAHRLFHAVGSKLNYGDIGTTVLHGLLRDVCTWQINFMTTGTVWCFDSDTSLRKKIYPEYKANRKHKSDPEELRAKSELKKQLDRLRTKQLSELGFNNVLQAKGYEADDLIASIVEVLPYTDEAVIVSTDKDLYQCLYEGITIWNPYKGGQAVTRKSLKEKYGIDCWKWSEVKCLAGCDSDNIKGIPGVGEKTAIKYFNGKLKPSKAHDRILSDKGEAIIKLNMKLVDLPFKGCPKFALKADTTSKDKWIAFSEKYGLESLKNKYPRGQLLRSSK